MDLKQVQSAAEMESSAKANAAKRVSEKYMDALRMLADDEFATQTKTAREVMSENRDVPRKLAE